MRAAARPHLRQSSGGGTRAAAAPPTASSSARCASGDAGPPVQPSSSCIRAAGGARAAAAAAKARRASGGAPAPPDAACMARRSRRGHCWLVHWAGEGGVACILGGTGWQDCSELLHTSKPSPCSAPCSPSPRPPGTRQPAAPRARSRPSPRSPLPAPAPAARGTRPHGRARLIAGDGGPRQQRQCLCWWAPPARRPPQPTRPRARSAGVRSRRRGAAAQGQGRPRQPGGAHRERRVLAGQQHGGCRPVAAGASGGQADAVEEDAAAGGLQLRQVQEAGRPAAGCAAAARLAAASVAGAVAAG